ncbi:hypothetical protein AURDEDRAFT_172061 [Auricularia subglabra TFB-10046 SS5]|nr:hypothetical protein AURDEDRAFT_172061 [Auricularia subglabra TFB-10046 SS5]
MLRAAHREAKWTVQSRSDDPKYPGYFIYTLRTQIDGKTVELRAPNRSFSFSWA